MILRRPWSGLRRVWHYLFECPSFWRRTPAFKCPLCQKRYRCYWDGHDAGGLTDLCGKCAVIAEMEGGK